MINSVSITVFVALFAVFIFLGFYGSRWRKGDLKKLKEWGMAMVASVPLPIVFPIQYNYSMERFLFQYVNPTKRLNRDR